MLVNNTFPGIIDTGEKNREGEVGERRRMLVLKGTENESTIISGRKKIKNFLMHF